MKRASLFVQAAVLAAVGAGLSVSVAGQAKKDAAPSHAIVHYGDLKWTPIIKGCDVASVSGDFTVEGAPFVLRLKCAEGTKIPAHWHPTDENVTVLKGTLQMGMGDAYDEKKLETMNTGNFVTMPKETRGAGAAHLC